MLQVSNAYKMKIVLNIFYTLRFIFDCTAVSLNFLFHKYIGKQISHQYLKNGQWFHLLSFYRQ